VLNTELNSTNIRAWNTFEQTPSKFLGNEKFEKYSEMVPELISSQCVMWVNVFENSFSEFKFWFLYRKHGSFMRKA
jgi:iron only hydrogenase large subunit-like protein